MCVYPCVCLFWILRTPIGNSQREGREFSSPEKSAGRLVHESELEPERKNAHGRADESTCTGATHFDGRLGVTRWPE